MSTPGKGTEQASQALKASFPSAIPVKSVKNAWLLRDFHPYRCFPVGSYSIPV